MSALHPRFSERTIHFHETLHCPTCAGELVTKLDAIARVVTRCPTCDRVAPTQWRQPDEGLVPQTLVRASGSLPVVREGQNRCQRCARGVEGQARFCGSCAKGQTREGQTTHCLGRGLTAPRRRGQWATTTRCAVCSPPRAHRNETHGTSQARIYAPRRCADARCGDTFAPTGPCAKYCARHRGRHG